MRLAETTESQENDIGFLVDEAQTEQILDLGLIDLFWPVPAEGIQGFNDWKTGCLDAAKDGAVLTCGGFPVDETLEVVDVSPVLGMAFQRPKAGSSLCSKVI